MSLTSPDLDQPCFYRVQTGSSGECACSPLLTCPFVVVVVVVQMEEQDPNCQTQHKTNADAPAWVWQRVLLAGRHRQPPHVPDMKAKAKADRRAAMSSSALFHTLDRFVRAHIIAIQADTERSTDVNQHDSVLK
jgi:hypothetical protein